MRLFDTSTIAEQPANEVRFYLYHELPNGDRQVLWREHDNADSETYCLSEYPRRVPKLYKTLSGAQRRAGSGRYWKIAVWQRSP